MTGPLRLGVVGPGDVAERDYLPELGRLAGRAEVVAFASRDGERARAAAARWGGTAHAGYEELLGDPAVDAILNLTPIGLHAEVTLAALAAGKHVYSEKPLAGGVAEARAIRDAAAQRGLVLVCAPCVMLFPQVVHAAEVLASGAIGTPSSVRASAFGGAPPWEGYASDPSPFFSADGGPLVDMAVYPLTAIAGLIAPVERVAAVSSRTRDAFEVADGPAAGLRVPVEVDDNWQLVLELRGGVPASVEANFCAQATAAPELEIRGDAGTLALSLLDVSEPVRLFAEGEWHETHVPHEREAGPDHLLGVEQLVECVARRRGALALCRPRDPRARGDRSRSARGRRGPLRRRIGRGGTDMTGDAPLRLGIVGTGAIALRGLLPHLTPGRRAGSRAGGGRLRPGSRARRCRGGALRRPAGVHGHRDLARPGQRGRRFHRIADRAASRAGTARTGGREARARQQDALDHGRGGRRPDRARAERGLGSSPRPARRCARNSAASAS